MFKSRNKTQAKVFAARYAKRAEIAKGTCYAIRIGCKLEWYNLATDTIMCGIVVNHSYGDKTGHHTFTIQTDGGKVKVMGRNLYPAVISHIQGSESAQQ